MPRPPRIDFPDAAYHVTSRGNGRYLHLNPVKTAVGRQLDRRARLRLLDNYRWSSYGGYADGKKAEEFLTYDVLHEFARGRAAARRLYRAFVEQCLLDDDAAMLKLMNASRYAIGDDRFVEQTEARIEHRRTGSDADRDLALPRRVFSIDATEEAVARHFQVAREDLARHGRSAGTAKIVAVELACRLTELSQRAIGKHYGGIGSAAVSAIHRKVREGRHDVEQPLTAILQQLCFKV